MLAIAAVIGVALLRRLPAATRDPAAWLAAAGVLAMLAFALIWLTVALGLVSKTVESASNLPMPLVLLPFLGSGFVPTDSMPTGLRWFAEYQPFTPVIETLRGLLMGTPIGNDGAPRGRLVHRHRGDRLPLGQASLQPRPLAVAARLSPAALLAAAVHRRVHGVRRSATRERVASWLRRSRCGTRTRPRVRSG